MSGHDENKDIKALRILRLQGIDAMFSENKDLLKSTLGQIGLKEDELGVLNDLLDSLACPESVAEYKELFAPAYTKRFDEAEMDEIIDILSMPTYQKYHKEQAAIMADTNAACWEWAQKKILGVLGRHFKLGDGGAIDFGDGQSGQEKIDWDPS